MSPLSVSLFLRTAHGHVAITCSRVGFVLLDAINSLVNASSCFADGLKTVVG